MRSFSGKTSLIAFALTLLALVGWIDYVTSYEVSVSVLYYLPIAYAAWNIGWTWSFAFGVLCAATLTWAEVASGRHYSQEWIIWERAFMRVLTFGFVAFSFNFFRRTRTRERLRLLQIGGVLPICTRCHRVRDGDGYWTELDAFLREKGNVEPQAKLCPDCAREAYANPPSN